MRTASAPFSAVFGSLARFAARMGEAGRSRRIVHGLAALDDRLLRDIGLTRHDVDAALVEPAMTDGTLVLAERARAQRRSQTALAREARAWSDHVPAGGRRAA